MASNVSKCAQTFSISVMTYVKTKELQLQCHCIALNTVKKKEKKNLDLWHLMSPNMLNYSVLVLLVLQKKAIKTIGIYGI